MEYQKKINLLDDAAINHLHLEQEIRLRQMINQEDHIMPTLIFNLKLQW